jgi:hypothetical protein
MQHVWEKGEYRFGWGSQRFGLGSQKERDHKEDIRVDGNILLKWTLKKEDVVVWTF